MAARTAAVETAATRVTDAMASGRLEQLIDVQQHDTAIDRLRHRRAHLPERAELDAVSGALAIANARRRVVEGEREALAGRQDALEGEVATLERRRDDLRRKLSTGTVPKELERLSAEVDSVQAHIGDLEDREIELMEAIEPLDVEITELERTEAELDGRRAELRTAVAEAERAVDDEMAGERAARAEAAASVPPNLLERYEKMRAQLGGVAVARLVGGRCTGCNLMLPTSEVDRIRHTDADTVVTCEQCGRLLVH